MKTEILVALLAGGLAGLGASLLLAPTPRMESSSPAEVRVDLDPLLEELRAMRRMLELPTASGHRADTADPAPLSASGSQALTAADLTMFLDALTDRLASALPDATDVAGPLRSGYARAHDRQAVTVLRETLTDDNEYSPASVFALTPQQVYTRYGTPTTTWTGPEGSLSWVYMTEDEENLTVIHFMNGYVISAWLE